MEQANRPVIPVEEQFKIMADMAPVLIWISGTDKLCYFFNAGWLRFTGRTMEQEHGNGWLEGVHPDDLQRCTDTYINFFDARKEYKMEYRLKRHDGQYRWLVDNGIPRYTPDGTFAGYIGSCMDIDELMESGESVRNEYINAEALQKEQALNEELATANEELTSINEDLEQAKQSLADLNNELEERVARRTRALLHSQNNFHNIILQAPVAMGLFTGTEMVLEVINDRFLEIWGKNKTVIGQSLLQVLPELEDQQYLQIMQEVLNSGEPYHGSESLVHLRRSGQLHKGYYNFINHPFRDAEGRITGIIVVANEVTEQVVSRLKIEESGRDLRSLVMTSKYALLILRGPEWIIEVSNQQMAYLWNKTLDEIVGQPLMKVLPELKDQPFPTLLKQVYNSGVGYSREEEILYLDSPEGSIKKYVSFSYDPMLDADGNVCGVIVSSEDVTEKVHAKQSLEQSYEKEQAVNEELAASNEELAEVNEELAVLNEELTETQESLQQIIGELAKSEARFRFLIQEAPVAIGVLNGKDMVIESANEMILKIWGKSAAVLGESLAVALPELEGQPFLQLLDDVYTSGKAFYGNEVPAFLEHYGQLKEIFFNFIYQPLKNNRGVTTDIIIVAIDVTEQVSARKKVERTEESLRMAIEAAELGSYYINTVDRIFVASPRLKEFFGFGPDEEVPYEAAINQIHPDYRQAAADLVEAAITKGVKFDMEYPVVGYHDGRIRWVRGIGTLQYDSNGVDSYFTGVLHEITEKKQDELRKNDFISMVSHELKTPLTSLKGYIQLLNRKANTGDSFTMSVFNKIEIQVDKMSALINGFLNVTRLESGKISMNKAYFNLEELLKDTIEETTLTTLSHSITMVPSGALIVYADRDKIGSVISNLLSNAIKYSPGGKNIQIKCALTGNMVQVSIKDEGIGIKPNDIKKLFDRYYRVESKETNAISGFGIGLYLSAEIIARHDGKIWAESEPGKGATFYFCLPLPEKSDVTSHIV